MTDDRSNREDRRGAVAGPRAGTPYEGQGGNLPHEVTPERQALVEKLAGLQISQAEIGMVMDISVDTIQRHYAPEFARGKTMKGIKLREHAYDFAFGVLKDPDDPEKGYRIAPDAKMTQFLLERQFGMIPKTEATVALTDLTPEAAAWLGRSPS